MTTKTSNYYCCLLVYLANGQAALSRFTAAEDPRCLAPSDHDAFLSSAVDALGIDRAAVADRGEKPWALLHTSDSEAECEAQFNTALKLCDAKVESSTTFPGSVRRKSRRS